jgi:hypothetical protein
MPFTGRLGQSDSTLANIRLGYWEPAAPSGLAGASHGVATVAGALSVLWALAGTSAGIATVSGTLGIQRGRQLTQEVVESDVLQVDRQRKLFQLVIEVDGYDWVLQAGRILSGQFV